MSVTSTVEKSVETNGVETYDSGDDWEIGVGNLIIDLDADLEKDRQKLEMNRFVNSKGSSKDCEGLASSCSKATSAISGGLAFPSVQPPTPSGNYNKENGKSKVKKSKTSKDTSKSVSSPSLYGIPEIYAGKTQDAQGRPGEAFGMNSALGQAVSNPNTRDVTVSCAKGKEEKNGKNQTRGLKRERDVTRAKKEKQDVRQTSPDFSAVSGIRYGFSGKGSPCHCGDNGIGDISKSGMDSGIMVNAIVGKKNDDEIGTPAKKLKTEKVESLFTVPAPPPPPPATQAPHLYAPLSPPISSPSEQLLVRTRSIGTNTREAGSGTDPACLGPCEPGTSVNLEGIVWHETEEGVLVVNVTWRKRTYVGTLLDCTRHDWAPPRFCESPSDFEMRGGRGRGKRMRLAIPNIPGVEPGFPKVRGLPHKSRGGAIHGKGRRGSLNLISSCKTPPFFTVEEIKPSSMMSGKRKSKPPADLDLSLVSEDAKTGKRIRAKSRSAPSTPQGKSDPTFLDQGCSSPTLIDCPHPNCNKKYKHINGLRYHQTHAHLDHDRKVEIEVEGEDRFSDCEESLSNISLDCTESNCGSLKKTSSLCKISTLGVPKSRRMLLNNDGPMTNSKTRRSSGTKGLIDSLSNLPIISNMTVVLENCLVTERNSLAEMPKLEAEGLIDKKGANDKSKKANGKGDKCSSKAKTTRPIAPAPPPPKLIAIPTAAFNTNTAGAIAQRPTSIAAVAHSMAKSPPLKPIKPKLTIMGEPALVNASLITCKDNRRKEKRRLKDGGSKEVRSPKSDNKLLKADDGKGVGKDFPVSLLKEHLSKQEVANGLSESQESRMASIRAEADKVYTFTDNAPSPSIGSSSRLDSGALANGDGTTTKTNSPAYSDISDAADDGGLDSRSEGARSKTSLPAENNSNKESTVKGFPTTPPQAAAGKEPQSPYYHGYDPYYLPGYMHTGQPNTSTFPNSTSTHDKPKKEETKEGTEEKEKVDFLDAKKADTTNSSSHSQLQLAMTQTQTALAQSLYYGQYARGLYMDQKFLMVSNSYRQPYEKYYDNQHFAEQKAALSNREGEQKEQSKEEVKQNIILSAVASKAIDSAKNCCAKPVLANTEEAVRPHIPTAQHRQGRLTPVNEAENQQLIKEAGEMKLATESVKQTQMDPKLPFTHESEGQSWYNLYQPTYMEQQTQDLVEESIADKAKGRDISPGSLTQMEAEPEDPKRQDTHPGCIEDCNKMEEQESTGGSSGDSRNARVAVSSPMNPHQSYIQYQHAYPYLQMCDPSNTAYRVMSPALVHNFPGFHYPLYGKTAGREESEVAHSSRGISSKPPCDSSALELLQHHNLPYHGKSPAPGERGSPEGERETERDRDHAPFARHLHTHHHTHLGVGYPLIPGQYDPYQGLSSAALVPNQQVSAQTSAAGNDGKI